ncbi:MAG TPA: PAS domain S-box protein [Terriglobales bacterium]|nr:PAS domain S-box protein [Terriglobales bacterium]
MRASPETGVPDNSPRLGTVGEQVARLARTIEKAPIGIANISPTGQFLMVNRHLCDMLGYSEPELMRRTFQDITYPPDLAEDLRQVDRVLRNEISGYSMEKRYVRKDGSLVWGLLTVSLIRNADGSPAYFISIIQDITLRKRMQAELQRSENRLQLLQALPGIGSWELDLDTGKCNWSAETYELMEQDRNMEPSLASFIAMVHPLDRKRVEKAVEQAVKGKREYNAEFRIVTPSKKVKHIFSRGRVFYNLGNQVLSGVAWEKPTKPKNSRLRQG